MTWSAVFIINLIEKMAILWFSVQLIQMSIQEKSISDYQQLL